MSEDSKAASVEIIYNPYEGLKLSAIYEVKTRTRLVEIIYNPYEGLKPNETLTDFFPFELKSSIIPMRD